MSIRGSQFGHSPAWGIIRIMRQHPQLANKVNVLPVHLQIVDRLRAWSGEFAFDAFSVVGKRGDLVADFQLADGEECLIFG